MGGYAINWLKDAMSSPVSNPIKYTDFENYMDIKIKENALLNKQLKSEKEKWKLNSNSFRNRQCFCQMPPPSVFDITAAKCYPNSFGAPNGGTTGKKPKHYTKSFAKSEE